MSEEPDNEPKVVRNVIPDGMNGMGDANKDALPEVAVVLGVSHGAPARQSFLVVPLRISEQAEDRREGDGDPQAPDDALDESGDGVGSSDEVRPIPLLPKTHVLAGHDGLLRKGVSWFQFNI